MNKQAFDRGFVKAALDKGVHPLVITKLLKHANFDFSNIGGALGAMKDNANIGNTAPGALLGAGVGGLSGYIAGQDDDPEKDHSIRDSLIGALGGGVLGGGANLAMSTADTHNAVQHGLGGFASEGMQDSGAAMLKKLQEQGADDASKPIVMDPTFTALSNQNKGINQSSFWQSSMGQQPIDSNVRNMMSRQPNSFMERTTTNGKVEPWKAVIGKPVNPSLPDMSPELMNQIKKTPNLEFHNNK